MRVFGQEYDVLRERAADVQTALQGVDGIGVVTVGQQPEEAQIEIKVDLAAAQEFGLTPGEVRRAAATSCRASRSAACSSSRRYSRWSSSARPRTAMT